jgi:N-glycosylase/DNA lyase
VSYADFAGQSNRVVLAAPEYDLGRTFDSGQAFRWQWVGGGWEGVIGRRWVRCEQGRDQILATTTGSPGDWAWLTDYLQTEVRLQEVLDAFPASDPHLQAAVEACRGLRLLRQDPWECLASFILSSTKQIIQIRQIIRLLCQRFGPPILTPREGELLYAFPAPETLAQLSEMDLRACKAGFRAAALRAAAMEVARGDLPLEELCSWPTARARDRLIQLRGVGEKIANCVLLFAFGKADAFPLDVWVRRALTQLYFRGRAPGREELAQFVARHFGTQAGYAQQYLFHYVRVHLRAASVTRD